MVPGLFNMKANLPGGIEPLCSFNFPREGRTSRGACEQAGNSMNVFVMGVIQMHSLACYQFAKVPSIIANVALAARHNRDQLKKKRAHEGLGDPAGPKRVRLRFKTNVTGTAYNL